MTASNILGQVHYLAEDKIDGFIEHLVSTNKPISLGFLNQYGFNLIMSNKEVSKDFSALSYLLRDGIGIKFASLMAGYEPKANLNGTDLIPQIITYALETSKPTQFFVYGTQEPWLTEGVKKLIPDQNVTQLDGFKDNQEYLENYQNNACSTSLKIVLLAMGMPKQEKVAKLIVTQETTATLVICGGAIIDFQAGKTSRAPTFIRENGMEWLYRLLAEPKRMFKRYVLGIPIFFHTSSPPKLAAFYTKRSNQTMSNSLKLKFINIAGTSVITLVLLITWHLAYEQFSTSIYADALSTSINAMQVMEPDQYSDVLANSEHLAEQILASQPSHANHYELVYLLRQWNHFHLNNDTTAESDWLLEQSKQIRPTWPITYVEKAKRLIAQKAEPKAIERQLALAKQYGPLHPRVQLLQIEYGFEQWSNLNPESRTALALQLLTFNKNYQHKSKLNNMIKHSNAAERICNLFKFNKIKVTSCQ